MRHSLFILMLLATCELLTVVTSVVAVDPPSGQRIRFNYLSTLLQSEDSHTNSAASCASTACHGGPRPGVAKATAARGAEYPLWLTRDPHAQAYRSLSSELGTQILQRLKILEGNEIVNRSGLNNCLACHNSSEQTSTASSSEYRQEGVACDRCHGPSRAWRNLHYSNQWPAWAGKERSSQPGFIDNRDLLTRARMCASCHVGDRQRNMNHDMIAAGHPPLLYEFATYHHRLPKHWRDPRSRDNEHYEATLWLVGQVAALESQAALIQSRAEGKQDNPVWPEFAHLDCAGCHQPQSPNRTANYSAARASWSHWNRWGVEALLNAADQDATTLKEDDNPVRELSRAMKRLEDSLASATASRQDVQRSAEQLQAAVHRWMDSPETQTWLERYSSTQLLKLLTSDAVQPTLDNLNSKPNWESLSQLYLAGVATRKQWPGSLAPEKLREKSHISRAEQLRKQLLFSPDKAVPQFQVEPATVNDAMTFLKSLQQLRSRAQP